MMSETKGERTKERILQQASAVFNQRGYFGTSLSVIMEVTGLEKGGIYNHFKGKDDLALQSFDYAVGLVEQAFNQALTGKYDAVDRLKAIIGVYRDMPKGLPVAGGCPVLNTAVVADDTHPALRARARQTMDAWRQVLRRITQKGIERQQVRPDVDVEVLATLIIALLEGAIMMTKLYDDALYMNRAIDHLNTHLETAVRL